MSKIITNPDVCDIWRGIGGHFDSLSQIICEFLDNSISNIVSHKLHHKNIDIYIEEMQKEYKIKIQDTGTGIYDFGKVLTIGNKENQSTPLNEHGFGLKHALASVDTENNNWKIITRNTADISYNQYRLIQAPYNYEMDETIILDVWPGIYNTTGTIIEFNCTESMFNTLSYGFKGGAYLLKTLTEYLVEELGFIYAGIIKNGQVTITIRNSDGYNITLSEIKPSWAGYYTPGSGAEQVTLDNQIVKIEYEFGEMQSSEYRKYYQKSMSKSGVEIRINGRLLEYNLFEDIWNIEKHNSYNHLLVKLNIITDDITKVPTTKTSKNGFRRGDKKLEDLFSWVNKHMPTPKKDLTNETNVNVLFDEYVEILNATISHPNRIIERKHPGFNSLNSSVKVDLYTFDGFQTKIYKGKNGTADVVDLYGLLMNWDGCINDGKIINEGVLVGDDISDAAKLLIELFNGRKDVKNENYNFIFRTWKDLKVKK